MISANKKAGCPCKQAKACAEPISTQQESGSLLDLCPEGTPIRTSDIDFFPLKRENGTSICPNLFSCCEPKEDLFCDYSIQSENVISPDLPEMGDSTQQENVAFSDELAGRAEIIPVPMSDFFMDSSTNVPLGEYLTRPVLIHTFTWLENNDVSESIFPWQLYFQKDSIKRKLDNFYMLRCKLHIKVVLNASPFYYGCVLTSYRPLQAFNPAPVYSGVGSDQITLIARSQRPNISLYPQNCQGGEMVLPFFYHKNWLDATSLTDMQGMGVLNFNSFDVLRNANSVVGQGVTFQVYAWAEDVELAGPTIDLAIQSKDEYDSSGTISAPASAISRGAAMLSAIPTIAPFATATSLVAGALGQIASVFGYTNVPVIDNVHGFKTQPFPQFASAHIGTPAEKLTLDPKNELSIDTRVCGVDLGDELTISSFVTRESFLYPFTWTAADAADTLLFTTAVNPALCDRSTLTSQVAVQFLPMGIPNMMYKNWRGDMVFRFKFICSKYHRGRVKISWDPHGDIGFDLEPTTEVYTKILDITSENDIEFIVPYTQPTSYLDTEEQNTRYSNGTVARKPLNDNGLLTVRVLTQQTSPVASADITVLVYARGSTNLEFANPRSFDPDLSPYQVQSSDVFDNPTSCEIGMKPSAASDKMSLVHMGETSVSLREYMRRDCYLQTLSSYVSVPLNLAVSIFQVARLPSLPGYDPDGWSTAASTLGAGTAPYNFSTWVPLNWVSQCFVAHRGSVHWQANIFTLNDRVKHDFSASRENTAGLSVGGYAVSSWAPTTTESEISRYSKSFRRPFSCGTSFTNPKIQPALSISAPMYSKFKMLPVTADSRNLGDNNFGTNTDAVRFQTTYVTETSPSLEDRVAVDMFVSIGTDYNPIFFLNVPTLYEYTLPAPA